MYVSSTIFIIVSLGQLGIFSIWRTFHPTKIATLHFVKKGTQGLVFTSFTVATVSLALVALTSTQILP